MPTTGITHRYSPTTRDWHLTTTGTLTDDQAKAITFTAQPEQVRLGAYVEVTDAEGIRAGELSKAELVRPTFGAAYVVCSITLT